MGQAMSMFSPLAIIIFFKNFKFKYYNILYFMEAQDKTELITEVNKQRLAENIKALGEPEKDIITGHFTFAYYSQVFRLVQKYAKESFAPRRKEYLG